MLIQDNITDVINCNKLNKWIYRGERGAGQYYQMNPGHSFLYFEANIITSTDPVL